MEEKSKQKRKTHFSTLKRIIAVFMQYKLKMSLIIISIIPDTETRRILTETYNHAYMVCTGGLIFCAITSQ